MICLKKPWFFHRLFGVPRPGTISQPASRYLTTLSPTQISQRIATFGSQTHLQEHQMKSAAQILEGSAWAHWRDGIWKSAVRPPWFIMILRQVVAQHLCNLRSSSKKNSVVSRNHVNPLFLRTKTSAKPLQNHDGLLKAPGKSTMYLVI